MSATKYCDDPDNCNYADCPTAFCDRNASTHSSAPQGSASPRRYATSVVLCQRLDGGNSHIRMRLCFFDCASADEAKGRAVTDAMTNNPGHYVLLAGTLDVTPNDPSSATRRT